MHEAAKLPERLGRLIVSPKAYAKQKSLLAGFRWLRANLPLGAVETEGFDPFWVVTKHADILEIIRQHNLFHNGDRAHTLVPRASDETARALTGGSPHPIRTLVHMDQPDHLKYRRITQSWFTQQRVKSLEDRIRAIARASVDRMAEHGSSCDFVRDVAIHYPLHVLKSAVASPLAGYCGSGVSGEAWRPEMQPGRLSDGRHKPAPARSRRAAPSFRLGRGSFHGIIQKRAPRKLDFD